MVRAAATMQVPLLAFHEIAKPQSRKPKTLSNLYQAQQCMKRGCLPHPKSSGKPVQAQTQCYDRTVTVENSEGPQQLWLQGEAHIPSQQFQRSPRTVGNRFDQIAQSGLSWSRVYGVQGFLRGEHTSSVRRAADGMHRLHTAGLGIA